MDYPLSRGKGVTLGQRDRQKDDQTLLTVNSFFLEYIEEKGIHKQLGYTTAYRRLGH